MSDTEIRNSLRHRGEAPRTAFAQNPIPRISRPGVQNADINSLVQLAVKSSSARAPVLETLESAERLSQSFSLSLIFCSVFLLLLCCLLLCQVGAKRPIVWGIVLQRLR